ncbi:MAG TPA: RluA family pseudouridine synthase [Aquabacterium sp.]|uniref:RluA family pseudouridine synthase n=1 Tax=Aquabacterium sp. TaxID=1872578 RepID=UPI002E332478|nr:RluA family pseudouridine synthase [Aquabacterium sp.]HEX5374129.1 RluA family pseudouridine synthase [Aquabacterium sp.]
MPRSTKALKNLPEELEDDPTWVQDDDLEGDDALPDDGLTPAAMGQPPKARQLDVRVDAQSHGRRIDQVLVGLAGEFSRSHLKALIERGCVQVDGQAVTSASRKVQAGQRLQASLEPTAESKAFVAEPMVLPIVFEDEHMLVINKPVGMVVHPAAGNWSGTLLNGLLAHHAHAAHLPRAGIVHRLDKDTSGLMVVGKTLMACTALTRAIAAREVHRQYQALVWGQPPQQLRIDAPIGRDPVSRVRMAIVATGKPAMTDVHTVATAQVDLPGRPGPAAISAVECTLHTGRTHQIRVHLSSRKWPLLADGLYGGSAALGMTRQALHAARLTLAHPFHGGSVTFDASLPPDMAAAWSEVVHNGLTSV